MMAVIVPCLVNVGGCLVLKSELDEAKSANLALQRRLAESERDVKDLELENQQLEEQLAAAGPIDEQIHLLTEQNRQLQDKYETLYAEYDALLRDREKPLPEEVNLELQQLAESHPDLIAFSPQHGMVKLAADLTFPKGSREVNPEGVQALQRLARIVNSPNASGFHIYVAGHTDDIPIVREETKRRHPNNWYLSAHRAVEVEKVLTDAGMDPHRIAVMGFGEYHPIAANAPNHGGNAANRRVELWLVPPGQFLTRGE